MPAPTMWVRRSPNMRVVTVVMTTGLMVHALSIATDHWVVWHDGHAGLFTYLTDKTIEVPRGAVPLIYPGMSILSFLTMLCDVILNLMFLHKRFWLVMPALFVFAFVAGLMYAVIIILWAIPHMNRAFSFSWSFYMAISVVILDIVVAGLCLVEFMIHWRGPPLVYTGIQGPMATSSEQAADEHEMETLRVVGVGDEVEVEMETDEAEGEAEQVDAEANEQKDEAAEEEGEEEEQNDEAEELETETKEALLAKGDGACVAVLRTDGGTQGRVIDS